MELWETRFRDSLISKTKEGLTDTVNNCFDMSKTLNRGYTSGKRLESLIWRAKGVIAIEVRKSLHDT
jgi:hypothetical protein